MLITQISYAGFIMLSVEEEEEEQAVSKLKVILRVCAMVAAWIHSTAKLNPAIVGLPRTEYIKLCSLGNTNSENAATVYLWNCDV